MADEMMEPIDKGLSQIGRGIRRTKAAFDDADDGFMLALEGLQAVTLARGTIDQRLKGMQETIAQLQQMVLENAAVAQQEIASLRDEIRKLNPPA